MTHDVSTLFLVILTIFTIAISFWIISPAHAATTTPMIFNTSVYTITSAPHFYEIQRTSSGTVIVTKTLQQYDTGKGFAYQVINSSDNFVIGTWQ